MAGMTQPSLPPGEMHTTAVYLLDAHERVHIGFVVSVGFEWIVRGEAALVFVPSKSQDRTLTLPQLVDFLEQLDKLLVAQRRGVLHEDAKTESPCGPSKAPSGEIQVEAIGVRYGMVWPLEGSPRLAWWLTIGLMSHAMNQVEIETLWTQGMDTIKRVDEQGWPPETPIDRMLRRESTDVLDELED